MAAPTTIRTAGSTTSLAIGRMLQATADGQFEWLKVPDNCRVVGIVQDSVWIDVCLVDSQGLPLVRYTEESQLDNWPACFSTVTWSDSDGQWWTAGYCTDRLAIIWSDDERCSKGNAVLKLYDPLPPPELNDLIFI